VASICVAIYNVFETRCAKTLYRAAKNDAKVQKHCTGHQKLIKIKQYFDFCNFKLSFCCYTQCLLLRASIFAALHNVFALWHRFLLLYTAFLDIVLQKRCAGQQKSMPVSTFAALYNVFATFNAKRDTVHGFCNI